VFINRFSEVYNLIIISSEAPKELTDKAREISLEKLDALEKSKTIAN